MSDEDIHLRVAIEAIDADTIEAAVRTRLTLEGPRDTVSAFAELILEAAGGVDVITKATTYSGDDERDVTALFKDGPERLDPLSTGDDSVEA